MELDCTQAHALFGAQLAAAYNAHVARSQNPGCRFRPLAWNAFLTMVYRAMGAESLTLELA